MKILNIWEIPSTSHSTREVLAVQSSKRQKLIDFLPKPLLDFSQTVSTYSLLEGHESPGLNLASRPCPDPTSQQSNKDEPSTAIG